MRKLIIFLFLLVLCLYGKDEKVCPKCGATNPIDAKFCWKCGYQFQEEVKEKEFIICPSCSTKNPIDAKFCLSCGKPLTFIQKTDKSIQDTLYSSLGILDSIYVELVKIRKLLSEEAMEKKYKIKEKQFKEEDFFTCLLIGCSTILLLSILLLK